MGDLISLSEAQIRRVEPYFLLSHGMPKVDDRRFISGVVFVIRNCRRWRNAPADYGPPKPIYNLFLRWSRMGVFNKIFAGLAAKDGRPDKLMINATRLRAHHTGASLLKKGGVAQGVGRTNAILCAICIAATIIFSTNQYTLIISFL